MRNITRQGTYALFGLAALAVILPAAAGPALAQTTWYVDINVVGGDDDGTSWNNAYTYLQDMLLDISLSSGDTILVAGGTYYPDEGSGVTNNDESVSFDLINGVNLRGGYHGYCALACHLDPNERDETTFLSGDIDDDGLDGENSRHVLTAVSLSSDTLLDRFTVTLGYGDGSAPDWNGGGISIRNCSDFTITECTFDSNYAVNSGGAVYVGLSGSGPSTSQMTIENCEFTQNRSGDTGGALRFNNEKGPSGHNITIEDTDFSDNVIPYLDGGANGAENGGALAITGANLLTIERCDFTDNLAHDYGGAMWLAPKGSNPLREANITDCTFNGNSTNTSNGANGGAIYMTNVGVGADGDAITFLRCTFKDNVAREGAGAIWVLRTSPNDAVRHTIFNLTDCKFLRNKTLVADDDVGGGAIMITGHGNPHLGIYDGKVTGTWSGCLFVDNEGFKGGAVYITSTSQDGDDALTIDDCTFVGNVSFLGGGALCISDKNLIGNTEVRICSSKFISNGAQDAVGETTTENKGGAVYNRIGSTTIMVNCIIAGNFSEEEGGGTCNAIFQGSAATRLDMHNCLLAGNWCETNTTGDLDVGGGHFNRNGGDSELVNCTFVGNYADYKYGGVANRDTGSTLLLRNSVFWANSDNDSGTTTSQEQFHYEDGFTAGDVDNNVIEGCDSDPCTEGGENTDQDPEFEDEGATTVAWDEATYDTSLGETTFHVASLSTAAAGMLYKPDPGAHSMLLIKSVIDNPSGNDEIVCYGYRVPENPGMDIDGKLFDLHIDDTGSAYNYGAAGHLPLDVCDLDDDTSDPLQVLPLDLYGNDRELSTAPDAGVHEIDPG